MLDISAMSVGALSKKAVLALNAGAERGNFAHNTGEGGISPYHLEPGGDLIWQIGTGYFGCRAADGGFDHELFLETVASAPVRAIEIKLSQGAKPGMGGILPAAKVTPEIARIRGIPVGKDCLSPAGHRTFRDADEMLEAAQGLEVVHSPLVDGVTPLVGGCEAARGHALKPGEGRAQRQRDVEWGEAQEEAGGADVDGGVGEASVGPVEYAGDAPVPE